MCFTPVFIGTIVALLYVSTRRALRDRKERRWLEHPSS